MRKIKSKAIFSFSALAIFNAIGTTLFCLFLFDALGVALLPLYFIAPIFFYFGNIITYRIVFYFLDFPLQQITKKSSKDFAFQMYSLYYIVFFNFFVHNSFLPIHLNRIFHQILGAKFGIGSYNTGYILDPPYVEIGHNSIIGFSAVLCSHALEGENISFDKIKVGDNVTIGLRSMIMPGVTIEDNAIVAAGALVTKNTHIKAGEVWAGIPAKRIKQSQFESQQKIIDFNIPKLA